jgi:hypothetical protein
VELLHNKLILPLDNTQHCEALRYTLHNEVSIDAKFLAAKALTELHKNYNNFILSIQLDESYTISPTDSITAIRDKCKIAFNEGVRHYPMLVTYAVPSDMGLGDSSLTSTGLSEGGVGEGIDYPLSGLVGAYNSNLPILKKPLLLKYADDESGLHRDDDEYEADDQVDEVDSSTERVRRYYKRHPKKVSKYLKDTVKDRVARNRDRRKAVKKHGKSKMKNHDVHHPKGPNGGSWKLAKKDHGRDKVKECYSPDSIAMDVQQFVSYAAQRLNLQQIPVVSLMPAEDNLTSLGKYDVISNQIFVVVEDRLLADILRTIAHELAHQKQNEMGYITNPTIDGATGSRIENGANIIAGILLRDYGKIDNGIYLSETTIKCRVCGWSWDSKDGGEHPFMCHKCWNHAGRYLMEGGAAGHLAHPFEDEELTFKDMKEMIDRGLLGGLDQEAPVTEKLDGQNIAFSIRDGQIIFARNKGQVKSRGKNALDVAGIRNMFSGRGNIEKAFTGAAEDLQAAVERLTPEQRQQMFGDGSKFMSLEVILPDTQNVIPYGKSVLVMHGTIEYDEEGNEIGRSNTDGKEFADAVTAVGAEQQKTFGISGPKTIAFSDSETEQYQQKAEQYNGRLDRAAQQFGLDENSTLADYRRAWWEQEIQKEMERTGVDLSEDEFDGLVSRWADGSKKFGVKNIENDEAKKWFRQYEKESLAAAQKKMINPIEMTFLQAGTDSLRRVTNFLSVNNPEASNQLKRDVLEAIKAIRDSNQPDKIAKLQRELERLEAMGIDNVVPSEGVVFIYNGKPYKFTGQFAPINQITGTFKFGMAPAESEEPEEPKDIKSVTDKLQFKPVTKKPVKYSNHGEVEDSSALEDMEPMSFATATGDMEVVTITADGKETENTAVPGDIIMSGPSGEKYVVKAAKFEKLYTKQDDDTVIPEQSPRQVARYIGKDEVTFTAPWGEQMVLKPGDYLVKDGEGFYRVAKKEYEATYNLPEGPTSSTSTEPPTPTEPATPPRTVAIFTGRFQPFHAGHYSIYQAMVEKFGKENVYIATSDKTDATKSPFGFKDRQEIMTRMFDIPKEMVVQVKNPYAPAEILDKLPDNTTYVTAVSQKDADRLDRGGKYFKPYDPDKKNAGYKEAGYYMVAPEMQLTVNGKNISGTQLRAVMGDPTITDRAKQEIFTKVYGKFDKKIFDKIVKTTTESEEAAKLTAAHGVSTEKKPTAKPKAKKPSEKSMGRAKSILKQKIENPKTGRKIFIGTALTYDKTEPVRIEAERRVKQAMQSNESVLTENTQSEKMKVYVYIRDYTKDELENEVGEYFKNERTIEAFPDMADSAEELKKLILAAPSEVLTKEELEQLSNSEVPEVLSSKNPKEVLKKIGTEYKRDVKGILTAIKGHEKLPEPIVIKHSDGYYLLGGNTRLSALAAMRQTMPVKVLQYGAPMVGSVPTTATEKSKGKGKGNKKALFQKILQMKITNPETGNQIKIDTAMDYDRLHPAHKVAMGVIRQHMRGLSNRAGIPKNRTD